MVTAAGTEAAGPARVWVLTLAVCALLGSGLVACGRSQDDEAATRSLASSLRTGYAPIDAEQAACVAQSWVSEIGLETLSSSGALNHTTTNDLGKVILPRDDAIKAVDALNDCTDLAALTTQIVAGSLQATVSQTDCIQSVVDDRVATRWVEADLQGKATDDVFLLGAARCMSTPVADRRAISTLTRNLREVPGLSQSQADCVARGLVEQVGTHQLTAMGVLGKRQVLARALLRTPLTAGMAELGADVLAGCVPAEDLLAAQMEESEADPEASAIKHCLLRAFSGDNYRSYLVGLLMNRGSSLDAAATDALADCLQKTTS